MLIAVIFKSNLTWRHAAERKTPIYWYNLFLEQMINVCHLAYFPLADGNNAWQGDDWWNALWSDEKYGNEACSYRHGPATKSHGSAFSRYARNVLSEVFLLHIFCSSFPFQYFYSSDALIKILHLVTVCNLFYFWLIYKVLHLP